MRESELYKLGEGKGLAVASGMCSVSVAKLSCHTHCRENIPVKVAVNCVLCYGL